MKGNRDIYMEDFDPIVEEVPYKSWSQELMGKLNSTD